jgi:hypothetical protein
MSSKDSFVASGSSPTDSGEVPPDFLIENPGSIFTLKPLTPSALSWIDEHTGQQIGFQSHYPHAVVVEPRYIADIVAAIQNDGWAARA